MASSFLETACGVGGDPAVSGKTDFCLVLSTCADERTARDLARGLVAAKVAACVNIVPGLLSVYAWKGDIHTDEERLLIVKTRSECFEAVRDYLRLHHPYELPEIVAVPVAAGSSDYLAWIDSCLLP